MPDFVDAIVLAGGKGTRLQSVVNDRPKVLADVLGRPFLSYLLDQLVESGQIRQVVLSIGYMADAVVTTFGQSYRGMPIFYGREAMPLGTGGGIRLALEQTRSDPVLVCNGDSYCAFNVSSFLKQYIKSKVPAALLVTEAADVSRYGRVEFDERNRIVRFEEKGASTGPGLINAGIYLISRSAGLSVPQDVPVSMEREIFPKWIDQGLFAVASQGPFIDIGTPESYAAARAFFANI